LCNYAVSGQDTEGSVVLLILGDNTMANSVSNRIFCEFKGWLLQLLFLPSSGYLFPRNRIYRRQITGIAQ
jgi:hypothetical protein